VCIIGLVQRSVIFSRAGHALQPASSQKAIRHSGSGEQRKPPAGTNRSDIRLIGAGVAPASNLISYEKEINLKLSANEVYYTAYSLRVILKNSCSKIHCRKV